MSNERTFENDKKRNSAYWDEIDGTIEAMLGIVANYSTTPVDRNMLADGVADIRESVVDFLKEIGADISDENREFIMNIYHKSIKSTMDLLLNDDRYDLKERMKYLHSMFSYKLLNDEFDKKEEKH